MYDACVSTGDKADGTGKYWTKVGTVFQNEKGLSLKLDVMPLAKPGNNGYSDIWINFFVPTPRDNGQQRAPLVNPQSHPLSQPPAFPNSDATIRPIPNAVQGTSAPHQVPAAIQSQFPDAVIQQQPTDNIEF